MKVKVLLKVKVRDAQGIEHVRCEVKQSADTGIVRLVGEINWWNNNNADNFRAALDALKQAGITKLKGYINSPGGSVWEANEIYNLIVSFCPEENRTLEVGALCASAATTVALAFPVANTKAFMNVTWMKHNPRTGIEGEERDMLSAAKLLKNIKDAYVKGWAKRMKISETTLRNKMDETWWMSQEELTKYNIVSGFIDSEDKLPYDTRNVFNKLHIEKVPVVLNHIMTEPPTDVTEEEEEDVKPTQESKFKTQMKNFILLLMASMNGLKNFLPNVENSTEAEAVAALTKVFNEKEAKILELTNDVKTKNDKVIELENKVKEHNAQMIKALLDVAQNTEKKITAEQRKVYEAQAATLGYEGLSQIINALTPRQNLKNLIEGSNPKPKKGAEKEEEEEEREEPEFTTGEGGRKIYDGRKSSQQEVYHRMAIENAKKLKQG